MRRLIWLIVLIELGLACIGLGLLIPAHLRAVDSAVIEEAGATTPSLIQEGTKLVSKEKVGAAQLVLRVAQAEKVNNSDSLLTAIQAFSKAHPDVLVWGGADPYFERLFPKDPAVARPVSQPIVDFIQRDENRERLLEFLLISRRPSVAELLKTRTLTNTVFFPPVPSAAGKTLDSLIVLTAMLLQGDHLGTAFQDEVVALIQGTNRSGDPQKLERFFLDLFTFGKRLDWTQLTLFLGKIENVATFRSLAYLVRNNEPQLPVIFTAVCLGESASAVADYLVDYKDTGIKDLRFSLGNGLGALQELLRRQEQVYYPLSPRQYVVAYEPFKTFFFFTRDSCRVAPWLILSLRYGLFLLGGFFLARSYQYWRPARPVVEERLQVPSLAPARQGLWAVFALLVLVFLSEPFLAQESQQVEIPLRLPQPKVATATPATPTNSIMNAPDSHQISLLSLVLFFVLQALIYTACLIKLAEIRRQNAEPRLKLRLLENEEHLFDAGLYLGFVGTIIALILMSLGVIKPSLMAGYSSTSFGIIFVSILKIFHVRPLRRRLILESEASVA